MPEFFLAGDVMTGRGIDQILAQPNAPQLFEPYVDSALDYVRLAEQRNGVIPRAVEPGYIWGAALDELARRLPAARIINLETAVTRADDAWPGKGIHYRMHPANTAVLTVAHIDVCVLANNHVLDWGYAGLDETLGSLQRSAIRTAGAGPDALVAAAPAVVELPYGARLLVFGWCTADSGVWPDFGAAPARPGVALLPDLSEATAERLAQQVHARRRPGDVVIGSIHWGPNWGYRISEEQRRFAHRLIDAAQVDVVHGHSSHHPKGIEIHRDRLILYGCGDLINDYEGISGHDSYRPHLALLYFATLDAGALRSLTLVPLRLHRFRLEAASADDRRWLLEMFNREGRAFGTRFLAAADGTLDLLPR